MRCCTFRIEFTPLPRFGKMSIVVSLKRLHISWVELWFFLHIVSGLTGIALTVLVIIIYVFAMPFVRRNLFNAFWFTHSLYIILYMFMLMHGWGRLVQAPITQNFLAGPLCIYVIDKLISVSRNKLEISVQKAELLPSGLYCLVYFLTLFNEGVYLFDI